MEASDELVALRKVLEEAIAARAAAEARAAAAETALDVTAAEVADTLSSFGELRARLRKLQIESPSKQKAGSRKLALRAALSSFSWLQRPLFLRGALPIEAVQNAFEQATGPSGSDSAVLLESNFYKLATYRLPAGVMATPRTGDARQNAAALFGARSEFEVPEHVELPLKCEPEIFAVTSVPGAPAFAAEVKSLPAGTLNEAVTYALLAMAASAFKVSASRPSGRVFHAAPPTAHVLIVLAHVGYLLGVEWVGKLLLYPVSQPFFLGSDKHANAIAALPSEPLPMDDVLVLPEASPDGPRWGQYPDAPASPSVYWTADPTPEGRFLKVIECDAFDEHAQGGVARLRALYAAHAAYAKARGEAPAADPQPSALVATRLRFGAFALLVEMPFVGERAATERDLREPGAVPNAVAAAVGWLARRGLLYVDLRPLNVRCGREGDVWLVDYDDMLLMDAPASSADAALAALRGDANGAYALEQFPALADAIRAQWVPSAQ
jgi:hypothetical protein